MTATPKKDASAAVTFAAMRLIISTMHTSDPALMRGSGPLGPLSATHNAYPVKFQSVSVVVLLPKGLKPPAVAKLTPEQAMAQGVLIVRLDRGKITRLWPS